MYAYIFEYIREKPQMIWGNFDVTLWHQLLEIFS